MILMPFEPLHFDTHTFLTSGLGFSLTCTCWCFWQDEGKGHSNLGCLQMLTLMLLPFFQTTETKLVLIQPCLVFASKQK